MIEYARNLRTIWLMKATVVELPAFARYRADYLDDEHFRGLRKLRHGDPRRGKGRNG